MNNKSLVLLLLLVAILGMLLTLPQTVFAQQDARSLRANFAPAATATPTQSSNAASPTITGTNAVSSGTAGSDGSVVYTVKQGDSLWGIAIANGVKVDDIRKLNKLSSDVVYVGQKLVLVPPFTPTLSPTITLTPKPPTRTPRPTSTRPLPTNTDTMTPATTQTPAQAALPTQQVTAIQATQTGPDTRRMLAYGIIGVCLLGLVMVIVGAFKKN